jgi:hypothetical protein
MSIVDDFAAIGGRLAEIEKIPAKVEASTVATSWMSAPIVWTPEWGYGSTDTAPSEYCAPAIDCG